MSILTVPTLILLLLFPWLGPMACTTTTAEPLDEPGLGFLWEATRGQQIITLLGTMHIGVTAQDIPSALWQRFDDADTVIIETDISEMNEDLARRFLMLPPPQSLDKLLEPKAWSKLQTIFKRTYPEMPKEQLQRQSPAIVASQLLMAAAEEFEKERASPPPAQKSASEASMSMDQLIFERARTQGKRLATLEALSEQLELLKKVFTPAQLGELIENYEEEKSQYGELENAYRQGRAETIAALLADMPKAMRELLLDKRNLKWSQSFADLLSPRHTLLAVGAAHFGGEESLLKLLEAQGFTITPLRASRYREI